MKFGARSYFYRHVPVILSTGGSLYDVTSCLATWSHFPSKGVSFPGSMFLPGCLCRGMSLFIWGLCPGVLCRETPQNQKSGQYASYWNASLLSTSFGLKHQRCCRVSRIITSRNEVCDEVCPLQWIQLHNLQ